MSAQSSRACAESVGPLLPAAEPERNTMRIRRIAVLIDGGFFLKRLPTLVGACNCTTPQQVADIAHHLCKRHAQRITRCASDSGMIWLDHAYRLFYYDAAPYEGVSHHPVLNREIEFGKSD